MLISNKIKDIQELSIIVQSKHNPRYVRLIPDSQKISLMAHDTINTFRDQQKFKVFIIDPLVII